MLTFLIVVFVIGYLTIALEHPLKIDKTATALLLGMAMWVIYTLGADTLVPIGAGEKFASFAHENPNLPLHQQALQYILNVDIVEHLGEICQTLLFLIGAMTIVELLDVHGGFRIITDRIITRKKVKLLWIISFTTFFMSAVLDNLTTTIVMIMLLRKLIADKKERWMYAATIVLAANSGGAWSPIGDITTIMLWVKGNVTVISLVKYILLPSLVSMIIPVALVARRLKGKLQQSKNIEQKCNNVVSTGNRNAIFFLGVGGLIFVPIFKSLTHLPPFIGMLLVLGILWVYTEIFYNNKSRKNSCNFKIPKVISRIDMPSILFFLGILMAVAVLQSTGILRELATMLDQNIHDVYIINSILGILSAIVDNVPLVAAAMGMYPIADPAATGYAANFVVDGTFWELLSYCAGVGGSILIIGSAAGVVAMGLEKISFGWYLRNFSLITFIGYACGVLVYALEKMIF